MIGTTYTIKGRRCTVLCRWTGKGPRNVLVRYTDTREVVCRPFRGLRRVRAQQAEMFALEG